MFNIVWFSIRHIEDIIPQSDINTKDPTETIVVPMCIEIEEVKIESQTPERILVTAIEPTDLLEGQQTTVHALRTVYRQELQRGRQQIDPITVVQPQIEECEQIHRIKSTEADLIQEIQEQLHKERLE